MPSTPHYAMQAHERQDDGLVHNHAWAATDGYTATHHQREIGVGYFDAVAMPREDSSIKAFAGSTEVARFHDQGTGYGHERHDDGLVHNHDWAVTAK